MRPKDIGTRAETAVTNHLRLNGYPAAERRALHGTTDKGDIAGTPYVWEVKAGDKAKTASDGQISAWLQETAVETVNAGVQFGFLVTARDRKNVRDWWAHLHADTFLALLDAPTTAVGAHPIRMRLDSLLAILRRRDEGIA